MEHGSWWMDRLTVLDWDTNPHMCVYSELPYSVALRDQRKGLARSLDLFLGFEA